MASHETSHSRNQCSRLHLCNSVRLLVYGKRTHNTGIMKDEELLKRITLDHKILAGKPVIKGTRLSVEFILNLLAHGATKADILGEYEGLTHDDIKACLLFAGESLSRTDFMPLVVEPA
jgi:uncharacterized protein (DUF433 family)